MSRRLSLVMLFGLITTVVLSFGLSGGAAAQSEAPVDDEVGAAQQRLADLRMEAGSAYEAHDSAVLQLAELDEEIAATGEELAAAQKELDAAEADLQVLAAQMYKSGNVGFVDVLVGAEDFSEFANRVELWMDLIVQQRDEFESVLDARDALAEEKAELETQRENRAAALTDADAQIDRAVGLEADAQAYLDSLNAEVLEAMEAESARQADEQARIEGEKHAEHAAAEQAAAAQQQGAAEEAAARKAAAREAAAEEAAALYAQEKKAEQARLAEEADEAAARAEATEQESAAREEAAEQERLEAEAEEAARLAELAEQRAAAQAAAEEKAEKLAAEEQEAAAEQYAAEEAERLAAEGTTPTTTPEETTSTTPEETTSAEGTQYDDDGSEDTQYNDGSTTGAAGAQPSSTCADDFGGVQPHVAEAGCDIVNKFGLTVHGIGYSSYHTDGLSLDIYTSDETLGNQVRDYVWANYSVNYTIWWGEYRDSTGYREGGHGHFDHVHVTFN